MLAKPWLSHLLPCVYGVWHVRVLLSVSVASSYASIRTSGPPLLPTVSRLHHRAKTKSNRPRQCLTAAPFQARDRKPRQNPRCEVPPARSLQVFPLRLHRHWAFFTPEMWETCA